MTSDRDLGPSAHEAVRDAVLMMWNNAHLPDVEPDATGFYDPWLDRPAAYREYAGTEVRVAELPERYRNKGHVWLRLHDGHTIMARHHEFIRRQ